MRRKKTVVNTILLCIFVLTICSVCFFYKNYFPFVQVQFVIRDATDGPLAQRGFDFMGNTKKNNDQFPCFKCKVSPRYKNQSYCKFHFIEKTNAYQKEKFKKKREKKSSIKIKSTKGEVWKKIDFFEGYFISNKGRIKSTLRKDKWGNIHKNEVLLTSTVSCGYLKVKLYDINSKNKKTIPIHRLLAIAFIPNPKNYKCINHIDGNKLNNNIENLEWCTLEHNIKHAHITGLIKYKNRENSNKTKLFKSDIVEIQNLREKFKLSVLQIAKMYNVTDTTIYRVLKINYA